MASNSQNVPCLEPEKCGVQSHRPGTVAYCYKRRAGQQKAAASNLSAPVKPIDTSDKSTEVVFDDDGVAEIDIPYESDNIIESLEVYAAEQEDGSVRMIATGRTTIDFHRQLPEHWSKKQKNDFLNANYQKVDAFLLERYGIENMDGDDWEYQRADFSIDLGEQEKVTEEQAFNSVYEDTKIVQLYNELDRGTFGSENFDRLFAEALDVPQRDERHQPTLTEVMTELDEIGVDLSDTDVSFNFDKGEHEIDTNVSNTSDLSAFDGEFKAYKRRVAFSGAWTGEEEEFQRLQYTGNRYAQSLGADEGGYAYMHNGSPRLRAKFIGSKNLAPFMRKHQEL